MRSKGRPTSLEIAVRAGVSQPTVSRALRGNSTVSEETRRKILQIARELNYTVDKHASSLRCQQSNTLALLFFEDPTADDSLINPFFLSMLGPLTRTCVAHGFDLLISFQQMSSDWHAEYEDSKRADGIILLGYGDYVEYQARLKKLVAQGTHFVRWGAVSADQPGVAIGCDNFQGGIDVTEHLLERGRSHMAFLGHASEHYPEFLERYRGCVHALEKHGKQLDAGFQFDALSTEQSGYDAAVALLNTGRSFDAIFCASDLIAIGAMRALQDRGLRIPHDVAIAGFDDIPTASFTNPGLTTVQQDTKQAAVLLVESLVALVHGEEVPNRTIPAALVVRQSTG